MISNSYSTKLKAFKSVDSQENQHFNESADTDSVDGDAPGDGRKYNVYDGRGGRGRGIKSRQQSDYKSFRGTERRGFRGRGGVPIRRSDREYADGNGMYIINRKYQDTVTRSTGTLFIPLYKQFIVKCLMKCTKLYEKIHFYHVHFICVDLTLVLQLCCFMYEI